MEDVPKPFIEHLEELRLRLIRSLVAVAIGTGCVYYKVDSVLEYLARPVGKFVYLQPTEAFFVRFKIALSLGLLSALPVVLYQVWSFVSVALMPEERRSFFWILPASYILFISGFSFGFWVLVPAGVRFLLGYSSPVLSAQMSVEYYVNFVATLCIVLGGIFQMPLASFFLTRLGLLQWAWLAEKRRIAVLLIYALSAVLTPGPDPVTALLLALPTYILFELSVMVSRFCASGSLKIE